MRRLSLACALLIWCCAPALADVKAVRVFDPRPFGYFVGDTIERSFEIETSRGDEVVAATLPRQGPVNYWLELRSSTLTSRDEAESSIHRLTLIYQSFYAPLDPRKVLLPDLTVTVKGAGGSTPVTLPQMQAVTSPIRELFPELSGDKTAETFLRPNSAPGRIGAASWRNGLMTSLATLLVSLVLAARHFAVWPFHNTRARPFTVASRKISRHLTRKDDLTSNNYQDALRALHRAFDHSAGRNVMADDVTTAFLSPSSPHRASAEPIAAFFEASRRAFFAADTAAAQQVMPPDALKDLADRLAVEERAAR